MYQTLPADYNTTYVDLEETTKIPPKLYQILKKKSSVALSLAEHIVASQRAIKANEVGIKEINQNLTKLQESIKKSDQHIKSLTAGAEEAKKLLLDNYGIDYDAISAAEKM